MFKNTVEGLGDLLESDIKSNKIILTIGPPGGLKSGFTYSLLSWYLHATGDFGVYNLLFQ